jgi:hypothetical protein
MIHIHHLLTKIRHLYYRDALAFLIMIAIFSLLVLYLLFLDSLMSIIYPM